MSEEQSPVEVVAEEASADYEKAVEAVAEALRGTASNGDTPKPQDFRKVLQSLKTAVDDQLEEEGVTTGPDPDRFIKMARELVADNYNQSKHPKAQKLKPTNVHIDSFTKTLQNWKAIISSPIIKNYLWVVTFNGNKGEAYVDAFRRSTNVKVEGVGKK